MFNLIHWRKKHFLLLALATVFVLLGLQFLPVLFRGVDPDSEELCKNTRVELIDWHIAGLWIINSPVAWFRVTNSNQIPIHDVCVEYRTYALDGRELEHGEYTMEGEIAPGTSKNFIEQYIGLVDLYTEKLSVKLKSVHGKH